MGCLSRESYKVHGKMGKKEAEKMNHYQRLKDIREDKEPTQADIAKILQTTRQQVGKWENGVQMMGIDKYITLAQFYNISLDYLTGLIDSPKRLR